MCNLCYTYEKRLNNKKEYDEHKSLVADYRAIKTSMLPTESVLHCEFDFGQHLPLQKLSVNEQFFRILLWLYIFNVHVFKSTNSYMFYCFEGNIIKGAYAVCNFVEYVIFKKLEKIIIIKCFCILMQLVVKIEIIYLYDFILYYQNNTKLKFNNCF